MVCLIKSKYKEELDLYTQLLGSEKRAYAILCCNNGYTLDKTKDGKPSKLYNDLLEYYKGDVTKAVQKKAQLFTSEFTKDYGQWYQDGYEISDEYKDVFDENGEPLLHNTYFGTADNKILLDEQKEFASIEEEEQYILEHATRDENGKLLAPNGKPSNLTEKQYAQVRTKAFKEWFGDWENDPKNASKIVDENGEPLVVYRGDAAGKNTFEAKPASYNVTGIYLAGITEMVQRYVEPSYYNNYKEGEIYQVFVDSKNPFIGENRDIDDWNNGKLDEYDAWIYGRFPKGNGELVVRNSEQIKSATDNVGTFSRTNDNIYKRRGEKRGDHMYSRERAVKYIKDQGYTIHDLEHDTYETRFEVTLEAKIKEEPWRSYIENMDPGLKVKYAGVRIGKKDPRLQVKIITREAESIDSFYKFYNKKSLTTAHDLLEYIIKQTKDESNRNFYFIRAVLKDIDKAVPGLFNNINIKLFADNNGDYSAKYDANTKTIIVNSA